MSANGLHRIRWRRVAVARIHRTAASQFARDLVNIQQSIVQEEVKNVGKRTPSDPMETGCRGKNPSHCRESVRKRLSKYSIQQSIVEEEVENVGKRTPSDPMETSCRGKNPSDCRESVRKRLSKYSIQQSIVEEEVENVGKRTPSDPMETSCRGKNPSDCHESVRKRLSKYSIQQRGGKCRQTDSIGSDGDGLPWQESIGLPGLSNNII